MKLLVFAHTPPPHHGQSYMVELMIEGFGGDARKGRDTGPVQCYHVNCRLSDSLSDIGKIRFGKALLLVRYCMEAIWCRFRYRIHTFYYIPAPGKRAALYRDWFVMALCRPFFKQTVFHWHALGLSDWLVRSGNPLERWITSRLLEYPTLSVALARASERDARAFKSRKIEIVFNGIPDACPDFEHRLLTVRQNRISLRREQIRTGVPVPTIRALFLAQCTPEKGLFDTLEAVAILNGRNGTVRAHLTVAGDFPSPEEEQRFRERVAAQDLSGAVIYAGFVSGKVKRDLLEESDCLCFPTYYDAESFGLVIIEAMASGLPCVTTRWRAIPEMLPPDYPGYVDPKSPEQIADALEKITVLDLSEVLRSRYLSHFSLPQHRERLRQAFTAVADR